MRVQQGESLGMSANKLNLGVIAEFSEKELAYFSSAIASINVWNRLGVIYRWTLPVRQKAVGATAS
jgi:hypothetical protein